MEETKSTGLVQSQIDTAQRHVTGMTASIKTTLCKLSPTKFSILVVIIAILAAITVGVTIMIIINVTKVEEALNNIKNMGDNPEEST